MVKKYEDSGTGQLSEKVEQTSNFLSRLLQGASDMVAGINIQNIQVFALENTAGSTAQNNFTPKFEVEGVSATGEIDITGYYPVHANNGAGELGLEKSHTKQLNGFEAHELLTALESGAKIEDCMNFSGWQKDGEDYKSSYARGSELDDLEPNFSITRARGSTNTSSLAGLFNQVSAAPDLNLETFKDNLRTFIEIERGNQLIKYANMPTPTLS